MSSDYPVFFRQTALLDINRLIYTVQSNAVRVDGLFLKATNLDASVVRSVTIYAVPSDPLFFGVHNGAANAAVLTDTSQSWEVGELVGRTLVNQTDGSEGEITANTATTVTATLSGGIDNDWDVDDIYNVDAGFAQESIIVEDKGIAPNDYIIIPVQQLAPGAEIWAMASDSDRVNLSPIGGRVFI